MDAVITINGQTLTVAQKMTLHVALQTLAIDMRDHGLGDDETGQAIATGYLRAVSEMNNMMAHG